MENIQRIDEIFTEFRNKQHIFEYVSGVPPVDYESHAAKIEHAFREICRTRGELLIRVNYPFVRADQIAIKLICELYETLDDNHFLCSQLPNSYKAKYVALYKSITQNISVNEIIRHAERKELETGAEASVSSSGGMDFGIDFKGLKAELNHTSNDAVINTLKKRSIIEDVTETNQQIKPEPLDLDSATRALQKLIDDLAQEELTLYSEHIASWWNNIPKRFASKNNLRSLAKRLLNPIKLVTDFFLWLMRLSYEILQVIVIILTFWSSTLGKRHAHILLTLQTSVKDKQETDFSNQLNALITNPRISCVVFEY